MWRPQREKAHFCNRELKNSTVSAEPLLSTAQVSQRDDVKTTQPHLDTRWENYSVKLYVAQYVSCLQISSRVSALFCRSRWKLGEILVGLREPKLEPEADVLLRGHAEPRRFDPRSAGLPLQVLWRPDCQAGGAVTPAERDEEGDEQRAQQGAPRNWGLQGTKGATVLEVTLENNALLLREKRWSPVFNTTVDLMQHSRDDSQNDVQCFATEAGLWRLLLHTRLVTTCWCELVLLMGDRFTADERTSLPFWLETQGSYFFPLYRVFFV